MNLEARASYRVLLFSHHTNTSFSNLIQKKKTCNYKSLQIHHYYNRLCNLERFFWEVLWHFSDDHHPAPTFTPPELPKRVHVRGITAGKFGPINFLTNSLSLHFHFMRFLLKKKPVYTTEFWPTYIFLFLFIASLFSLHNIKILWVKL